MQLKQFDASKNMFCNDVMIIYSCQFHITEFMCQINDLTKLSTVKATENLQLQVMAKFGLSEHQEATVE